MKVAGLHEVASIAARPRSGKRRAHSLPPHRIAGELDRSSQPTDVGNRRAKWLRDHLQRRDIDQATLVCRVFQPNEWKQSVDAVEARLLLITSSDLQDLEPTLRSERSANFVSALGGRQRAGVPWRSNGDISVDYGDVAEADPRSPTGLLHARARHRVARKDPIVIPFSARLPVEHDDRTDKLHFVEFELLAPKGADAVLGPDLVRFDEWRAGTVGDNDIVQRDSVQEVSGNAADVDDAVAVSLNQPHDIAAHALSAPVAVGDQEAGADQQQRHHRNNCEEANPPPTH